MNTDHATQQNKTMRQFDERRGAHLLRPGDVVRCNGEVWDVAGIYLHTERRHSTVGLVAHRDLAKHEFMVPLMMVEVGCEIFLRAEGPADR